MPRPAVLDSSVILAVILDEPGSQNVVSILEGGLLSTVNLAEVHARLLQLGAVADHAWNRILSLQCEVSFFTDEQARVAAELIAVTKPFGLSLGDRACLALAIERKARVYTTDKVWKNLLLGIEIEVIR
ncbi:MAG: type II toxin-antitoxin system VapC family toxin [Terracidiphilus sp.]